MKRHNLKYLLIFLMISATMAAPGLSFGESPEDLVAKGNAAYDAGKYDDALAAYDQAATERPADAWIDFNKGAAFFRKGELDKAKDAWEKAALGATEVPLEAESLYNLGTLEFSKLTGTRATDPEAALEAGDRSVRYYHEAKDLLNQSPQNQKHPLITDASENIELVRRTMKVIEEEIARRKEAAQNQAQASEDLKNLIDQQQNLNTRTQDQAEASGPPKTKTPDETPPETGQPEPSPLSDMAREQERLQEQTQKTAEQLNKPDALPDQSRQTPDPAEAAKDHLQEAQARQKAAADKLTAGQASEAMKDQASALEEMKTALDLLQYKDSQNKEDQKQDGKAQTAQNQQENPPDQTEKKQEVQAQPQDQMQPAGVGNTENPAESGSDSPMARLPDDAERILGEEKENKRIRRQVGIGGYQDVDRDW